MSSKDEQLISRAALRRRKLQHGFKAAAKRRSSALRREYGIGEQDPLDCRFLAKRLGVHVYNLSSLESKSSVRQLTENDPGAFSAATVPFEANHAILVNDAHAPARQASSMAHELAHLVLEHKDWPPLNDLGCRVHQADVEAEAEYMGSVLLLTDSAVMAVARAGTDLETAATYYGVSKQMMQWRYNDCGAKRRVERERGARRQG